MTITQITATNFKGGDIKHALAPATAIIGPNMTGKTAIVQAIRLALAGYLPECGKLPRATWELSSGALMRVQVDFDTGVEEGAEIKRRWFLDGQTVKTDVTRRPGILDELENLPLLNAEAYFGMTDTERTAYVFERVTLPDSYTAKSIIAECERISFEGAHSEAVEEAKAEVVNSVRGFFEPASVRAGDPSLSNESPSIQEAISIAIEGLRSLFTYHNKRAKDTQGAVTTLAELKLREKNVMAASVGSKADLEAVQTELDVIHGETGKLEAEAAEASKREARREFLRRAIYEPGTTDHEAAIAPLERTKKALAKELHELAPDEKEELHSQILMENKPVEAGAASLKEQEKVIKEAEAQLQELSELTKCPYCESSEADWRQKLASKAEATIRLAMESRKETTRMMSKASKTVIKLEAKWEANEAAIRSNALTLAQMSEIDEKVAQLRNEMASCEATLKAQREEYAELPEAPNVDYKIQLNTLKEKCLSLDKRRVQLRIALEQETRLQQELKLAAQAELEHYSAKAHVVVIKRVADLLKEKREGMVTEVFNTLLKVANEITQGILKTPLALYENTVGRWEGTKFIPHRVFSGTEKALTYIAIAVALSAQAPLKLVILDEFGRLDEVNQVKVFRRLTSAVVADIIDQFIVIGTSMPQEALTGSKALLAVEVISL